MNPNKPVRRKTHLRWNRSFVLVVSVLVLLLGIVGTSVAYLSMKTEAVENQFAYGQVSCTVEEDFKDGVKKDVTIKNTGNILAFIRVRLVFTWKDADGSVYGAAPQAGDYTLEINEAGWQTDANGYYYYTQPVAAGESTPILIKSCKPNEGRNPEGYALSVEILADAIQSEPANAVSEAWGMTVENGGITPASGN